MYTDELVYELFSVGPVYKCDSIELGPDEVIAIEGIGTFHGVSIRDRVSEALSGGKNIAKLAAKVHRESTRRGHSSLATSAILFGEISNCSRLASMLIVAPVFGSYLQESQRRAPMVRERLLIPAELRGAELEKRYSRVMDKCFHAYKTLSQSGIELEDSRYVLPLSAATSLFTALSLESNLYLLRKVEEDSGIVPAELRVLAEKTIEAARSRFPLILESRLSFRARWGYYAVSDPLRQPDRVLEKIAGNKPADEAELLSVDYPPGLGELDPWSIGGQQAGSLFRVLTAEALSLAAYHQAIRHRTVPTVTESLVEAAERWLKDPEGNMVVPPSVKSGQQSLNVFTEGCTELLELYSELVSENQQAAALYALPNSVKLRIVRSYNLFNLLSPMGFLATRTCSAAQWEERAIAYKLWRDVARTVPWLMKLMGEKCKHLGYCPEREWCPIILKYREYSDELHRKYNQ
ncbi:MAG: FAD-dependent thymidylate synthase [Nitrososphaerota archaeon]